MDTTSMPGDGLGKILTYLCAAFSAENTTLSQIEAQARDKQKSSERCGLCDWILK